MNPSNNETYQGLGLTHKNLCRYPDNTGVAYRKVSAKFYPLVNLVHAESLYYLEQEAARRNRVSSQLSEPCERLLPAS